MDLGGQVSATPKKLGCEFEDEHDDENENENDYKGFFTQMGRIEKTGETPVPLF
jgi:hypothetical protein